MKNSPSFSVNYKYHIVQGSLSLPEEIRFNPGFLGTSQTKSLVARSTFDVPITIKTVTSNDMRVMPHLLPVVLRPNNKTEFGTLSFDPQKQVGFHRESDLASIFVQAFPQFADSLKNI
jgi:hypothetical protein